MALITINDIQESESFLTELNHTHVAMDEINGGHRWGGHHRPRHCHWRWKPWKGWFRICHRHHGGHHHRRGHRH